MQWKEVPIKIKLFSNVYEKTLSKSVKINTLLAIFGVLFPGVLTSACQF